MLRAPILRAREIRAFSPALSCLLVVSCAWIGGEETPPGISSIPSANLQYSLAYNAVFERRASEGHGWSGGDNITSIELPFCSLCPAGKARRRLWLFGDTLLSYVGSDGYRYKNAPPSSPDSRLGKADVWGNSIAITYHPDAGPPDHADVMFDWGEPGGTLQDSAWLGLNLDTESLPDMHTTRVFLHGYTSLGFAPGVEKEFYVFREPAYNSSGPGLFRANDSRVPVYEYYSAQADASLYDREYAPLGIAGFDYRRVAFYVRKDPVPGQTIPLYRCHSGALDDYVLSTKADMAGCRGYDQRQLLGHVFKAPPGAKSDGRVPLIEYLRYSDNRSNAHHTYTTYLNDGGLGPLLNWPLSGIVIGNDLLLSFSPTRTPQIHLLDDNVFAIVRHVDQPYAHWGKPPHASWVKTLSPPQQYIEGGSSDIRWGLHFVKDDDFFDNRFVYILGKRHTKDVPGTYRQHSRLYIARVRAHTVDDVVDFSNWEFFDGTAWSTREGRAAPVVFGGSEKQGPVSELPFTSITPARTPEGGWVFALSDGVFLSPVVQIVHADKLTGPWTHAALLNLYDMLPQERDLPRGSVLYYALNAQQGLSSDNDRSGVLLSYVRSTACWLYLNAPEAQKPKPCRRENKHSRVNIGLRNDVYTPRFIEIPWDYIFSGQ